MKRIIRLACLLTALFLITGARAQLSGTYSVPATFTSVAAAINSLNIAGVSGPVTIAIDAGYTETVTAGGFTLNAITGASSTNTIAFQKNGIGANPILVAYTGGTATPASAIQDGVWRFVGADYVTIDGIDISDPNTTNPSTMEFGYGLFKASATNGCQYNTIKNCVITLNRVNGVAGSGPSIDGSKGISLINATTDANATSVTVTSAAGSNSFNKFYSNTIQNCHIGIALIGFADVTPFTFADTNNDVGGSSAATGNTILNFGGGGTTASAGISTLAQYGINISYNTVNSNNGSGINHAGILRGIFLSTAVSANAVVNNNTVTVKGGGTTQAVNAIQNTSGSTAASNSINITNNVISNCTYTTATTGALGGIINSGTPTSLNINNNIVSTSTLTGTGTFTGIDAGGAITVSVSLMTNTVTGNVKSGASGTMYCMRAGTSSVTVTGNTINNNSFSGNSGTSSSTIYGFYDASSPTYEVYTNNLIDNLIISGSSTSTGHSIYGIHTNSSSNAIKNISGNIVHSFSITNTSGGTIYGISNSLANTASIFKNKIYNFSVDGASGNSRGIYINSGATVNIFNNLIGDLRTPASTLEIGVAGIYINGGTSINILYNTVHLNASSTGTIFGSAALYSSITPTLTLNNNILTNLSTPTGTGITSAYRCSSATLTSYGAGSNNNSFYAGTPGANNLIFDNGTNFYQTLAAFQAGVFPREVNSITENTPFLSVSGSSANFLHINTTSPSLTESGGVNITGITDDFDGQTRYGNPGYTGSGTAPDIGADEFDQVLPVCSGVVSSTISAISLTSCAGQSLSVSSSGFSTGSGISYQWKFATVANGPYTNVSGGSASNHHAYASASHSAGVYYYVMVTTCSVGPVSATSNEISFTISPTPTSSISALPLVCDGANINLAGSTDIGTTYNWSGPNGFSSASQNTVISAAGINATGNYSLIATLNACSSPVAIHSITVSQASVNINNITPNLCFGNSSTLTANSSAGSYTWNSGPNTSSIVVSPTVTTIYNVSVTNVYSCMASATTTISVTNVTIAGISASVCANDTGTLSVNAYTPATINWYSSPTSTLSLGTGSTFTMSASTNTTVYAEAKSSSSGSLFTTAAGSSAFLGEMFDIVALNSIVVTGFDAQFATGSGTIEIWYRPGTHVGFSTSNAGWTLASSSTLTSNGTGVLTPIPATLSIPIPAGQTYAFYIVANTGPNVRYSTGTLLGSVFAQNNDIQILEGTTGNTYFSASTTPRAFNGTVKYEIPGCSSGRTPVTLTVNPLPVITVAQSASSVCYSTQATFTASGASTYTWVNGPASSILTETPTSASVYTVTGTDLAGCKASATASVGVNSLPVVLINPSSGTVCALSVVSFTASGASTYTWNGVTGSSTFSDTPALSTSYTVIGTDSQGCVASETVAVTTNSLPVITISPPSATICAQSIAGFAASGATTYTWNNNNNTTGSVFTVSPATSTTYSVEGTSPEGCTATTTVAVTTLSLPIIAVIPASATVCVASPATFSVSGAATYSWSSGSSNATETITPTSSGTNTYTVTGVSSGGCSSGQTVSLTTHALPVVAVSPASPTICSNESLVLTASGAVNYSWTPGATATMTLMISPSSTSSYTVEGTNANNCKNTSSVLVTVDPCTGLREQNLLSGQVALYPNPSTGVVTASFGFEGSKEITVFNSVGGYIVKMYTEEQSTTFDLSGYAKGVYFVHVKTTGASANYKIVIQ